MCRHCSLPARCSGEVPAEHQWGCWGANFLCEQRESQLSQAVLFPSLYAFGIYKYHPWATIKSGLLAVKIVPFQRTDMNSQEKQTWPSIPCLDFVVVWKEALGSNMQLD